MRKLELALQKSFENLSNYGRLFYTKRQLFYEVCRNLRAPLGIEVKIALSAFGLSAIPTLLAAKQKPKTALRWLAASGLILGTLALFRQTPHTLSPPISLPEFDDRLANYAQNFPLPKGLLPPNISPQTFASTAPDLTLYGLPRLLVCESEEIARMLRANRFHLETPCGILSLREAVPLPENFQKMLERAEQPQIFYLHDASLNTYSSLPTLRRRLNLAEEIPLNILGLRPLHAQRLNLFVQKQPPYSKNLTLENSDFLTENEIKFIASGFTAEVAAVNPLRLLRVLRRLILGIPTPQSTWNLHLPSKQLGFMS